MTDRELSLKAAAKLRGLSDKNVYRRRREGAIRTHPGPDRRTSHMVWLSEFDDDVAKLECRGPDCSEPATNAGEFCSQACANRKYPKPKPRPCKHCGESFMPDHEGHEFCQPKCVADWRWEHKPESFPQSERRGQVVTCACGQKTRYLSPAHLRVTSCEHCVGEARRRWWASTAGSPERTQASERTRAYWREVYETLERLKQSAGAPDEPVLDTAELQRLLGAVSDTTIHYYAERRAPDLGRLASFVPPPELVGGRVFRLYPDRDAVKSIQMLRATGPAWTTWLDVDWRLERAVHRDPGEEALRRELGAARKLLGGFRGGASGALAPAAGKHRKSELAKREDGHEIEQRIWDLRSKGKSIRAIANTLRLPKGQVERHLNKRPSESVSIAPY